jgi:hypothetical protein
MDCTLDILVARPDVGFLPLTVPHLVRSCRFPFRRRRLVVDTAPVSGDYNSRPGIGTLDELRGICRALRDARIVDSIEEINYAEPVRKGIMVRHFGEDPGLTHDYKGYPVYGMAYGIATAETDFYLHFDSDMLLHQGPEANWIAAGIELLGRDPDVLCVLPLPGPPTADGSLHQPYAEYRHDPRGLYIFKAFTSRKFLIDVSRFESALPLRLEHRPAWSGDTARRLQSWEAMVGERLRQSRYVRADLASASAWTLHPLDHGPAFLRALPDIIARVERGEFPAGQAGRFDLLPSLWDV